MKKINWQQVERKMNERIKGGVSFWERINEDSDFVKEKLKIQTRYNLPLREKTSIPDKYQQLFNWLEDPKNAKRKEAFYHDVDAVCKKFCIPEEWHGDVIAVITGINVPHNLEPWSNPKFEISRDKEGNLKWRCIITPETDLTNTATIYLIQSQQKAFAGNPPMPIRDKANPRKYDWRPVYEWHKRHPLFTIEEIAKKLGYTPQRIRLKFTELENDK